ncbi:MAG: adenylate/guanylate cyclase domain-containing protein [Ignavibacteriae bacterium]|nr:adenylate/guanylate cyclase domain-containing protein [Ignavibacteriota bacterium]
MAGLTLTQTIKGFSTKLGLAASVVLLTLIVTQDEILKLGILQRLELGTIDYRFEARGPHPTISESSDVIIIEVSDESFKSLPDKWPWPRSYYAHLIRNLQSAGARVVGIDIILSGNDVYDPANDEALRAAIRETGIVVLAGKIVPTNDQFTISSANDNYWNIFFPVDSSLGVVNVRADVDNVLRRYQPYAEAARYQPNATSDWVKVPMLGFAVLNKVFGLSPLTVVQNKNGWFEYNGSRIPKYDPMSMLVNYYGPSGTFRRIKFADVIDDETLTTREEAETGEQVNTFSDPDFGYKYDGTFHEKIVLVGSTMPEDKDLFPVTMARGDQSGDNLMYGVEIHANIIENVLRNEFIEKQSRLSEILLITLLAFLTFFVTSAMKETKSKHHFLVELYGFIFAAGETVLIGGAAILLFNKYQYLLTVISPTVAVVGGYFASTAYHYVIERKQRTLIKAMFSTYVNPSVVEELILHPEKLKLGGERKELTVLFSDIEGFTTISEGMSPEKLVGILNEYLNTMTETIFRNRGTLDKYEGDALMAFWGAPIPNEDHAMLACISALEMQEALVVLRREWRAQGKPIINVRIGINTGDMVVGNMGGTGKFDYTVIGDSVNLASRLEGANRQYRTGILVSQRTYDLVKDRILGRELDLITVKGRSEPVTTFELIQRLNGPVDPKLEKFLECYAEGVRFFRQRCWSDAKTKFDEAFALRPGDYPTNLYIQRSSLFVMSPPPRDWNGVFEMTMK